MPPLYEEVSKCHLFMKKFWNVMTRPTMIGWEQGSRTRYDDCWSLIIKNPCHSSRTFARWKQKWVSHRTVRMARNVSSADFTCSIMIGWGRWTMQNVVGSSAKSLEMVGVTPDCAHGECEKCRLRMLNTNDWLRWTVQNELYWRIYDLQVRYQRIEDSLRMDRVETEIYYSSCMIRSLYTTISGSARFSDEHKFWSDIIVIIY